MTRACAPWTGCERGSSGDGDDDDDEKKRTQISSFDNIVTILILLYQHTYFFFSRTYTHTPSHIPSPIHNHMHNRHTDTHTMHIYLLVLSCQPTKILLFYFESLRLFILFPLRLLGARGSLGCLFIFSFFVLLKFLVLSGGC